MSDTSTIDSLDLSFRQSADADWEAIAALMNRYETHGFTGEILRRRSELWDRNDPNYRWVAEQSGVLIGYARSAHRAADAEGLFRAWVYVQPESTGKGLGRKLLALVEEFATAQDANSIMASVEESCPRGQEFAIKNGYKVEQHLFESTLDLESFDPAPYQMAQALLENEGYRFYSLETAGDTDENWQRLWELDKEADRDVPGCENWGMDPLEAYTRRMRANPGYSAQGIIIAEWQGEWVGMNMVRVGSIEGQVLTDFTGVLRAHRGKGLAKVIKSLGITYAQLLSARTMVTNNDERNAPMLAVNKQLGFIVRPGFYMYKKILRPSA